MLDTNDFLEHFGVKGMKWGQRKGSSTPNSGILGTKARLQANKNRELRNFEVTTKDGTKVSVKENKKPAVFNYVGSLSEKASTQMANHSSFKFEVDGKQVGKASMFKTSKDEVHLGWLGIDKSEQGKGYGSAVFDAAVIHAKAEGAKRLSLEVPDAAPNARHIYEKQGFVAKAKTGSDDDTIDGFTYMSLDLEKTGLKHADLDSDELELALSETFASSLTDIVEHSDVSDFLAHYGVKGQKWGVRKDQHREYREADTRDTTNMVKRAGSSAQMTRYFAAGGKLKQQQKYTEEWYNSLKDGKEYIEKGDKMSRVVRGVDDRALQGNLYVSRLKSDNEMYKAVIPAVQKKFAFGQKEYHTVYQVELEAKRRMAMPSQKERVDMFIEAIQTPVGRQWMKDNGYKKEITELNAKEQGLKAYKKFNKYAGDQSSALNNQYFNTVKKRGYDALIDDNDAGIWSKKPTIIVGGPSAVKVTSVRQLSADEINAAQRNVLKDRDFKGKTGVT